MSLWEQIEEAARAGAAVVVKYSEEGDVYFAYVATDDGMFDAGQAASAEEATRDAVAIWQEAVGGPGRVQNPPDDPDDDYDGDEDADVVVSRAGGGLFMFTPFTEQATTWIQQKTPEDAMFVGESLMVEHRYAHDLAQGMMDDGLKVRN